MSQDMLESDELLTILIWSAITIAFYVFSKVLYRRWSYWWLSPLVVAPVVVIAIILSVGADYREYLQGTRWLLVLLGPTMVAFAVPVFERRELIRRHWAALSLGVALGSVTALATAWGLAVLLGLSDVLRTSMLPRSMSMPFAMEVSSDIGGFPEITAIFVVLTGVLGAALGQIMLHWLPLRSALARGALLGIGAHAAGVVKAHEIGSEEGSVAGLVMILVGMINVIGGGVFALGLL
ncbi:LrgB family protein [Fodinicurvata fenggangensis]|uniref:LrgB family protein n=1 Tax=Fodinicurvata fenggangensis TaxID=1121830 RepID=UPI001FDEEDCB|nr:LrgB family protein [Fodinicurvata fenggangensis]